MSERNETIQNNLDGEIILTHVLTSKRLLKLQKINAFTLYHFYCLLAKMQQTQQIKATQPYCMEILGWGKERFQDAKATLVEEKIVETVKKQDSKGHFHYYVKVHYLINPEGSKTPPQGSPAAGNSTRNALELLRNNSNALDSTLLKKTTKTTSTQEYPKTIPEEEHSRLTREFPFNKATEKTTHSKSYLTAVPEEDYVTLVEKYRVDRTQINSKAEDVLLYCESRGKKYSDYRRTLEAWVKKDYGARNDGYVSAEVYRKFRLERDAKIAEAKAKTRKEAPDHAIGN